MKLKYILILGMSILLLNGCANESRQTQEDFKKEVIEQVENSDSKNVFDKSKEVELVTVEKKENLKEVPLTKQEKEKLDDFFSVFSGVYIDQFTKEELNDYTLIQFGVAETLHTKPELFTDYNEEGNQIKISKDYVEKSAEKYFGKKIQEHGFLEEYLFYEKGYYVIPKADGEGISFSQVQKLYDNGDGYYTADLTVYYFGPDSPSNLHGTEEEWKMEGYEPIEVQEFRAIIKPIEINGEKTYNLIEYVYVGE